MLTAPFPWFGAKRRWADLVWERFGNDLGAYVEPFAGSLAVLLHRPDPVPREVVCDTDGALCNFWRAIRTDPEQVAHWADYPTIHQDLTARHRWLIQWAIDQAPKLSEDPNYYDAQAAGWWVWGISLWIGPGWCHTSVKEWSLSPKIQAHSGGQGVAAQRTGRPHMHNSSATGSGVSVQKQFKKRPYMNDKGGGHGVNAKRDTMPHASDQIPVVQTHLGARGVSAQLISRDQVPRTGDQYRGQKVSAQIPMVPSSGGASLVSAHSKTRTDLIEWFDRLSIRLKGVIVLNRGWESAVTPTVLMQTPSGPKPPVGIFLDPPYMTEERSKIYGSDMIAGESNRVAKESYEWALEHGGRYRVAYCCHEGDFPVPEGWTFETNTFGGIKDVKRFADRRDLVMFSPACIPTKQQMLW